MSILSTNKKLISIGAEYSAGQGIDITNHVISVVESAVGTNYSAGPNINIYDDEGQPTISSKDWSSEIADASANAYEQAIAQIPEPQDLSYLSGRIDTNTSGIDYISSVCLTAHQDWTDTIKGASSYSYEQSTSYFDNWVNGQYAGDISNITNKVTSISGNFDNYYKKTETSSKDEINDALQYVSANAGKVYEGVSPIVVNNTEDKISADTWTFSAGDNVSFVDDNVNKITRIDVELPTPQDLSYISAQTDKANQGVDYLSGAIDYVSANAGDPNALTGYQNAGEISSTSSLFVASGNGYELNVGAGGHLTANNGASAVFTNGSLVSADGSNGILISANQVHISALPWALQTKNNNYDIKADGNGLYISSNYSSPLTYRTNYHNIKLANNDGFAFNASAAYYSAWIDDYGCYGLSGSNFSGSFGGWGSNGVGHHGFQGVGFNLANSTKFGVHSQGDLQVFFGGRLSAMNSCNVVFTNGSQVEVTNGANVGISGSTLKG